MAARDGVLHHEERQRAKQVSRDRDAEDLRSGRVSAEDLARANDFFFSLDIGSFRIVAIGGRKVAGARDRP